jgi:CBS domain containing-hemolysin-like protein
MMISIDYILLLEVTLFVIMLCFSGFFSSSETALFSLNNIQLEQMRRDKHPKIGLIQHLLSQPRRLIITILIGNELVNVTASVISAAIIIRLLGAENKWINICIMVPILLLVGEITPKALAIRHNVAFASFESRPIEIFARITKPLRILVRKVADFFITLIIGKERSRGNIITEDMVRILAREAVGEGALDHLEAQFIDRIFDFGNKTLEDVMTPRSDIFFLPEGLNLEEAVHTIQQIRHTKIPVFEDNRDNIVGILYARGLLGLDIKKEARNSPGLRKFLKPPYFVPESKTAANLFKIFRERRLSIALTVDEYGGVTGLVTMEDLLECIFGEIFSPSDEFNKPGIEKLGGNRCRIDGAMAISDFNSSMESRLSDKFGKTLGGIILHSFGEIPKPGSRIELDDFRFTVTEVEANRIKTLECEQIEKVSDSQVPENEALRVNEPGGSDQGEEETKEAKGEAKEVE